MKKCYSLLRWPCLLQDVLNRRLLFKTNRQQWNKLKPSPIISFASGIGQKKTVDAAKICGGAENVVKNRNPANIRKWIARFYYFLGIYTGSACIAHNNCMSCPSIWATLSALLINILLGSFQLFLYYDQPLWGWNNPVQWSSMGEAYYPRRRRMASMHWLTDCFDVQPTTTSGNIITQSIIFSFSIS